MPDDVVSVNDPDVISLKEVLRQAKEYMNKAQNYAVAAEASAKKAQEAADSIKSQL